MAGGKGSRRQGGGPARLLALVWLVAAMLAMPIVASAQLVASRIGPEGSASRGTAPETGAVDLSSARQAVRALPVAELRFLTERTDAKPLPAGPDPVLLPGDEGPILFAPADGPRTLRAAAMVAGRPPTPEARAPPLRRTL